VLPASAAVHYDERTGAVTNLTFPDEAPSLDQIPDFGEAQERSDFGAIARCFLTAYEDVLKVDDADDEFVLSQISEDALGFKQVHFDQVLQGIPVWGAEILVEIDPANEIRALRGHYLPTPAISTTASLTAAWAKAHVIDELGVADSACDDCEPQLVIYDAGEDVHLAYLITANISLASRWDVLVDAHSGETLAKIDRVPTGGIRLQRRDPVL